jgi:hypothetical protein
MPDSNPSELILAVPGPEQMRAFPKKWIRAAIAKGELRRSQLIWSPVDNEWKQVRELPHLMPTRAIAPLPVAKPRPARVMKAGAAAAKASAAAKATVKVKTKLIEKDTTYFILRIVAICSAVLLACLLLFNYFMVEGPFSEGLRDHNLSDVQAYANYGGFCQVDVLTVHLLPSSELKKSNIARILISITKSSPHPISGNLFTMVSLTPGWAGGYIFNGVDWNNLRALDEAPELQQKLAILRVVKDSMDKPLMDPQEEGDPLADRTEMTPHELRVWNSFISSFTP